MGTAVVVTTIDELDLENVLCLALLSKERVDHGASALTDVVDPILVDQRPERDRFVPSVEPLE
jgi:hypothetical protein